MEKSQRVTKLQMQIRKFQDSQTLHGIIAISTIYSFDGFG